MSALAIGTIVANVAAIITLVVLLSWIASGILAADEDEDGNNDNSGGSNDSWWDSIDLKREELAELKIASNLLFLTVACTTLFVPMNKVWHPSRGAYDRFALGVLASSAFLVGSMLFVSFWHTLSFAVQEEEDDDNDDDNDNNNGDDGNNDEDEEIDEEALLAYHRKIVSNVSFVLALLYSAVSICIYDEGSKLPETAHGGGNRASSEALRARAEAHTEILSELWSLLSSCTITVFAALFVTSCLLSGGEEAERMREEGAYNLVTVLMWMLIVAVGAKVLGRKILGGGEKFRGTLGVGVLSGGTTYFALLLFMVSVTYVNFEERRNEGRGPATATSFACFFLSVLYLAFSAATYKFKRSLVLTALDGDEIMVDGDYRGAGDFERMDDDMEPGMRVNDSPDGDFKQMADDSAERGIEMAEAQGGDYQRMERFHDDEKPEPQIV